MQQHITIRIWKAILGFILLVVLSAIYCILFLPLCLLTLVFIPKPYRLVTKWTIRAWVWIMKDLMDVDYVS